MIKRDSGIEEVEADLGTRRIEFPDKWRNRSAPGSKTPWRKIPLSLSDEFDKRRLAKTLWKFEIVGVKVISSSSGKDSIIIIELKGFQAWNKIMKHKDRQMTSSGMVLIFWIP